MRTLTPGEVGFLFDSAQYSPYYPVIYTAVSTGLRQAELLGLRRRDVDLKLALFLRQYLADRESLYWQLGKELTLDDLVFTSVEGKPIDPGVLSHAFTRMARQANLNGVRFHDLRHTLPALCCYVGQSLK